MLNISAVHTDSADYIQGWSAKRSAEICLATETCGHVVLNKQAGFCRVVWQ